MVYLNDILEINCNKNDNFNLRIVDTLNKFSDDDEILFKIYNNDNQVVFQKEGFIFNGDAFITVSLEDVKSFPEGKLYYSIYNKLSKYNSYGTIFNKIKINVGGI